jgi:histidine decarboxylase
MQLNEKDKDLLKQFKEFLLEEKETFVGYPVNSAFDYSELFDFLAIPLNNVGDPFCSSYYGLDSRGIERDVLDWFAKLHNAPSDNYWGYVTNGGTEGNMYGLYLARELYPKGVVYYSQDTHYSVSKNIRVLNMDHVMIKSRKNGEMDYQDLHDMIATWRSAPPIIFANMGTTMKEGFDNINEIKKVLKELAIPEYYIHVDAALGGMTLPFIDDSPRFDFTTGVQSLSISGHKFIGSPIPCGVVLALKSNVGRVSRAVEYVGSLDSTISGSRNGFTPILLWYAIRKYGFDGFKREVRLCIRNAEYAVRKFNDAGIRAWKNDHAVTVVFPRPSEDTCKKWKLAVQEGEAHMICMPSVSKKIIDDLCEDLSRDIKKNRIFPPDEHQS